MIPDFKFALDDGLDDSFLPTRGSSHAAGWDVRAAEDIEIYDGVYALVPLGFRCLLPDGWWLEVRPRSSTFAKKRIHSLYGVVDTDYEGNCFFGCQYLKGKRDNGPLDDFAPSKEGEPGHFFVSIKKGDRIGQLVPHKVNDMTASIVTSDEFEALCKTRGMLRGAGGFGSSGDR